MKPQSVWFLLSIGALSALLFGPNTSLAAYTYLDAIDGALHPDSAGGANTFSDGVSPNDEWADTSGTDQLWRYRDTGPATVSFGTSSWEGRMGDYELYTQITGLTPNTPYNLRLYGVWSAGNNNWGLGYSLDGGSNWSANISRDSIESAKLTGDASWLENSTTDGVGTNKTDPDSDTRAWIRLGTVMSNGSGVIRVDVRAQPNTSPERGVYDGLAYEAVPEPAALALAIAAVAGAIFRNRCRT
jgi:hypothetical protein